MKKAKIMFSAIALLTIVGGTLAFKAQKFNGGLRCSTTISTSCPIRATTDDPTTLMYCTLTSAPTTVPCSLWLSVQVAL